MGGAWGVAPGRGAPLTLDEDLQMTAITKDPATLFPNVAILHCIDSLRYIIGSHYM